MPVSNQYKFKFIHIPKTGGSSIEKLFDLQHWDNFYTPATTNYIAGCWFSPQHFTHKMMMGFKPECSDWFSFTIVRNPYTKIISEFYYACKNYYKIPMMKFDENKFLEWFNNDLIKFDMDHKLPQYFFLDEPVNFILKFENLEADFHKLLGYLDIKAELIHDNNSNIDKNSIVKNLSAHSKELIYAAFKKDFEIFGYNPL
jgi:hypothetical protein